jgi:hypothetical protein
MMIYFGSVDEAARGGHSSPTFDFVVGFAVLALTWISYAKNEKYKNKSIWNAIGISAICAVFIISGVIELLR